MKSIKYTYKILVLAAVLGMGGFLWHHFTANRTIEDLLHENEQLKTAINNLSKEDQIGYAKVLSQETRDGQLYTKVSITLTMGFLLLPGRGSGKHVIPITTSACILNETQGVRRDAEAVFGPERFQIIQLAKDAADKDGRGSERRGGPR